MGCTVLNGSVHTMNITNSYVVHCEQKTDRSRNQKKFAQRERALSCNLMFSAFCFETIQSNCQLSQIIYTCIWFMFYITPTSR